MPHEPTSLAEPLTSWQIDFKDVTTVAPEPDGKRQHGVETLNMVDTGTSILVDDPLRTDFNAETVIDTLVQTLQQVGCPRQIAFDRDPRFVGSSSSTDFPAASVRFLTCVGIQAEICPPQRPDKNGFVVPEQPRVTKLPINTEPLFQNRKGEGGVTLALAGFPNCSSLAPGNQPGEAPYMSSHSRSAASTFWKKTFCPSGERISSCSTAI